MKHKNKISIMIGLVLLLVIVPVFTVARPQAETTKEFKCVADTYVDSANSNSNYGSADLKVSYYTFSTSETSEWTYLAFEVAGLPADAIVTEVVLEISVKSMPLDDHSIDLLVLECDAFSENTLKWENQPTESIDDLDFVSWGTITSDSRLGYTLSDDGEGSYEPHTVRGNGKYYFMLLTTTDNLWSITFNSRDDAYNPPKLAVTYTYTPKITPGSTQDDSEITWLIPLVLFFIVFGGIGLFIFWQYRAPEPAEIEVPEEKEAIQPPVPIQTQVSAVPQFCSICRASIVGVKFCPECGTEVPKR